MERMTSINNEERNGDTAENNEEEFLSLMPTSDDDDNDDDHDDHDDYVPVITLSTNRMKNAKSLLVVKEENEATATTSLTVCLLGWTAA